MLQQGMDALQLSIREIDAAMDSEKNVIRHINMADSNRVAEKTRDRL